MSFPRRSLSNSRRSSNTSSSSTTHTAAATSSSTPTNPAPMTATSPMTATPLRTSSRKISKHSRKSRSRTSASSAISTSASSSPQPNYFQDFPHHNHRRARVTMVPTTFAPVSAYFPRDYQFEFEDEGYDSASSSSSDESVGDNGGAPAVAAAGWRPAQGSLEMEFMFGDMDDEFMAELTRESTPADDIEMADSNSVYHHSSTPMTTATTTAWGLGQDRSMGGRVVDEDYD